MSCDAMIGLSIITVNKVGSIPLGSFVTITPMALAYRGFGEQAKLTALQVIAYPSFHMTPGQPPRSRDIRASLP